MARATVGRQEAIFGFPIVQAKGKERSREEIKVLFTFMEPICMDIISLELMYGNFVRELSQIPYCLNLCRKNHNKCVFGWFKSSFQG